MLEFSNYEWAEAPDIGVGDVVRISLTGRVVYRAEDVVDVTSWGETRKRSYMPGEIRTKILVLSYDDVATIT